MGTTEAEAARQERAAIRQAAPLYVAKAKAAEAEAEAAARAEAKATGLDAFRQPVGAIVETDTAEAKARAAKAAKARAELPAIEWLPAPKAEAKAISPAEARAALRAKAAARRQAASTARELVRMERAEARAIAARQARRDAVVYSADVVFSEAKATGQLAELAKAAGAEAMLAEAEARAAFLAETGQTEAEARLSELLEDTGRNETFGSVKDAGANSILSPAELAEVRRWAKAMHDSPAAVAGRQALDAMGPRANVVVLAKDGGRKFKVCKVMGVPDLAKAKAKAKAARKAHKQGLRQLAKAEAAEAAAVAAKAIRPIKLAEAKADRVAAAVGKLAARAAKAEAMLTEAKAAAKRPKDMAGKIYLPVATFGITEAAKAAELTVRQRRDSMPARYADRGPAAKTGAKLTDNTARKAIANVMALTEAETEAYWEQTWAMVRGILEAKRQAEAAEAAKAAEASAAARKAYKAAHERDRRRRARAAK